MSAAVTSWAWRTPLGAEVESVVTQLLEGTAAASARAGVVTGDYRCRLAAPVAGEPGASPHERFLARMGLWALDAAHEAASGAAVRPGDRLGVFAGVGGLRVYWRDTMPALVDQQLDGRDAWQRGLGSLHPFWLLRHLSNVAHALLAADLGARGEGAVYGGFNAGAQALESAIRAVEAGAVDQAVVFAHDSLLEPEALVELAARGAATQADLGTLRAPYDVEAAGFVPGEAAAALVLEPANVARSRALALVDAATGADGEPGEPKAQTMAQVAQRVGCDASIVDGAAVARPQLDRAEREQVGALVGGRATLTATLGSMGQLGAAAPLVQTIALGASMRRGSVAPIAGLDRPAPGPLRPAVERTAVSSPVALALTAGPPGLASAVRVALP